MRWKERTVDRMDTRKPAMATRNAVTMGWDPKCHWRFNRAHALGEASGMVFHSAGFSLSTCASGSASAQRC